MKKFQLFFALTVPAILIVSCSSDVYTPPVRPENAIYAYKINSEFDLMRIANDSLANHTDNTDSLHQYFNTQYHKHQSLYVQYHDIYHNGDPNHYPGALHTQIQHDQYDGIELVHHHIAHPV